MFRIFQRLATIWPYSTSELARVKQEAAEEEKRSQEKEMFISRLISDALAGDYPIMHLFDLS